MTNTVDDLRTEIDDLLQINAAILAALERGAITPGQAMRLRRELITARMEALRDTMDRVRLFLRLTSNR